MPHRKRTATERATDKAKRQAKQGIHRVQEAARRTRIEQEAAIRVEQIAEGQAPAAQRHAVVSADGEVVRDALADEVLDREGSRSGYRRADPLRRMHSADNRMVTDLHIRAANRLSGDYEIGSLGASGRDLGGMVDGGGAVGVSEIQLKALTNYREACDAMGASLRTPVQLIALHKWTVAKIATLLQMTPERASGFLVAGLDRLADHYWPDRPTRAAGVSTTPLLDPQVTDIPQDRLGRIVREKAVAMSG